MTYIGIDPGGSGGMAAIGSGFIDVMKLDATEHDIAAWLGDHRNNSFAVIEAVHSMPKQGVASSFKFGRSYGFLRGLLTALQIPFDQVTPQKWQQVMACRSKGDKNVTKARAQQLYPREKITHAIADAILLAEYARRTEVPEL